MAQKFEYDLGRYDKLHQKGIINGNGTSQYVQTLLNTALEKDANLMFWQEHFVKDGLATPLPAGKGMAAYTVANVVSKPDVMLDVHTTMSEVSQTDTDGFSERTGTIPQFARGLYETSMSREELAQKMDELGGDAALLQQYVKGIAGLVRGAHYTLSHLAASKLSTGGIKTTQGQSRILDRPSVVPEENKVKAGAKIWSSSDCDIPEQMRVIESDFRDRTGFDGAMEWNIDDETMRTILLRNAKFIEAVNQWVLLYGEKNIVILNGSSVTDTNIITQEQLIAYSQSSISKISPIRVCKETQYEQTLIGRNKGRGWVVGNAVLRPTGYAGVIKYSEVRDVRLLRTEASPSVVVNTAILEGGLFHIANIMRGDGLLRQYHTNIYGAFMPELTEFEYHLIVDTKTAN